MSQPFLRQLILTAVFGCAALIMPPGLAVPGDLDPSFGTEGKVSIPIGIWDCIRDMAVQKDGKIVAVGFTFPNWSTSKAEMALIRCLPNGDLDPSFGVGGKVVKTFVDSFWSYHVAIQADGKILVGGLPGFLLLRYNTDGTPDTTFGTDGMVSLAGKGGDLTDMMLQPDGKIILSGDAAGDFSVVRCNADGSLDTTFGTGGVTITEISDQIDWGYRLTLQKDGKIIVGGHAKGNNNPQIALARYLANGTLDTSFGGGGKIITPIGDSDLIWNLAVQADGKILAAGYSIVNNAFRLAILRYKVDGSLDTTFGEGGIVLSAADVQRVAVKVMPQPSGKFLVGVSHPGNGGDFELRCYNSDGSLDGSFKDGGVVRTDVSGDDRMEAGEMQSDGKVVLAGMANGAFALARYRMTQEPDVVTRPASLVTVDSAVLNAKVDAGAAATTVTFEYSSDGVNFTSIPAVPGVVTTDRSVTGVLKNLSPDITYHFRVKGTNLYGADTGSVLTFTTQDSAELATLSVSEGALDPVFDSATLSYAINVSNAVQALTINPIAAQANAEVTVNGKAAISGGQKIPLLVGENSITIIVRVPDGDPLRTYVLTVTRAPALEGVQSIVGSWWVDGGGGHNSKAVITFLSNGEYYLAEDGDAALDPSGQDGMEHGTYAWNSATGAFAATAITDTNGSWGLANSVATFAAGPTTLERLDSPMVFQRVQPVPGTILGSWKLRNGNGRSTIVTFLDNGEYFLAEETPDGMERGTYLWNVTTGDLSLTAVTDTNGVGGLSHAGIPLNAAVAEPLLTVTTGNGTLEFDRILPGVPEIVIKSPEGDDLSDGGSYDFGNVGVGMAKTVTITIHNTGIAALKGLNLDKEGANGQGFRVTTQLLRSANSNPNVSWFIIPVEPGGSTTLTIEFKPTTLGAKTALIRIGSNDADENPFDITLTGTALTAIPPVVQTLPATEIGFDTATLQSITDAQGSPRTVSFEYGLTKAYGTEAKAGVVSSVSTVGFTLSNLPPHTKYHFRAKATGIMGSAEGEDLTFTTANRPPSVADDIFSVVVGTQVLLPVLDNDSDPDGDTLEIQGVTLPMPSSAGSLTNLGNKVLFMAAPTFSGSATFGYVVSDGFGGTTTAKVTVYAGAAFIDPTSISLAAFATTYSVSINTASTGIWAVTGLPSWVSVSPGSGIGPRTIEVALQANASASPRSATLNIAGQSHVITQNGMALPILSAPGLIPTGIVGGACSIDIPTVNGPVIYTARNLPPGLTMDHANGRIVGTFARKGTYSIAVTARNAAGVTPLVVNFDLIVDAFSEELAGSYHGIVTRNEVINGHLGSRYEMRVSPLGGVTGKIVTGATAVPFAGKLAIDAANPTQATFAFRWPGSASASPLDLLVDLDTSTGLFEGTLSKDFPQTVAAITGWRQVWRAATRPATSYKGPHGFHLSTADATPPLPQGYGFGAFTVTESTGALMIVGKLPDNNALVTSTFVGPNGQLLIYQSLYGNKGTFTGALTVVPGATRNDNRITGTATWSKPAGVRDAAYREGFPPADCIIAGGARPPFPPGSVILGLPNNTPGNASLNFTLGGLETEDKEFDVLATIVCPTPPYLINRASTPTFASGNNPNRVNLITVTPATGIFSGTFALPGGAPALVRRATFQGQIVTDENGTQGYGYFILPQTPTAGQSPSLTPKHSGRVILRPSNP